MEVSEYLLLHYKKKISTSRVCNNNSYVVFLKTCLDSLEKILLSVSRSPNFDNDCEFPNV